MRFFPRKKSNDTDAKKTPAAPAGKSEKTPKSAPAKPLVPSPEKTSGVKKSHFPFFKRRKKMPPEPAKNPEDQVAAPPKKTPPPATEKKRTLSFFRRRKNAGTSSNPVKKTPSASDKKEIAKKATAKSEENTPVKIIAPKPKRFLWQKKMPPAPKCIIIAGPNGAGKTTFAFEYLPLETHTFVFINTDEIAREMELDTRVAGRVAIKAMNRLVEERKDFATETTLSGFSHAAMLRKWKSVGYSIEIAYLKVDLAELAVQRVANRVMQGGHDVPEEIIKKRVVRSWQNFNTLYKQLADSWWVFDANSQELLDAKIKGSKFRGWKQ